MIRWTRESRAIYGAGDLRWPRNSVREEHDKSISSCGYTDTKCMAAEAHPRVVRRQQWHLRISKSVPGFARSWRDVQQTSRCAANARSQDMSRARNGRKPKSGAKSPELVPNVLQRQFDVGTPNRAWVTDISYIRTWESWLYLAVVLDLFSRKIVGWAVAPTIGRGLVLDAVLMAVRRRRPKKEHIKKKIYKNRSIARGEIAEYIDAFYNPTRRHSHLGGVSPAAFEAAGSRR
jgi:transposase InsO family protein